MSAHAPRTLPVGGIDGEYPLLSPTLDQADLDGLIDESIDHLLQQGHGIAFKEVGPLSPPGVMLRANAAVVLRDCHSLELATPEATCATRIAASLIGLERLSIEALRAALGRRNLPPNAIQIIRGVTDFADHFWGHHVSIGAWHLNPLEAAPMLEAALVTSIYAGAGWMTGPIGWAFRQKGPAIATRVSVDAREHPLMDAKNQTLAREPWTRVQISSSDAPRSDRTLIMKIRVFTLLIHAFENGALCGYAHALEDPLDALRRMDADPTFNTRLRLASGREATPLEIQRHYQRFSERYAQRVGLPWLVKTAELWGRDLARLETGPDELGREHDPFIKWKYLNGLLSREVSGDAPFLRDGWPHICRIMHGLPSDLRTRRNLRGDEGYFRDVLPAAAFETLRDGLGRAGIAWRSFPEIARLWQTVRALDLSYHSLTSDSLYDRLVRSGQIEPPIISDSQIHEALSHPPSDTRAKARAAAIEAVADDPDAFATWDCVAGREGKRDFPDPLDNGVAAPCGADTEDLPF